MSVVTIEIKDSDVLKALSAYEEGGPEGVGNALYSLGLDIFHDSQIIVPRDTGALAGSGGIDGPYQNAQGNPEVIVYYGGPAAGYALVVHEDLDAYHDEPTTAKYLEGPFLARVHGIEALAGVEIAKELARRGAM